jgi:release factor glutamine methyltransferase
MKIKELQNIFHEQLDAFYEKEEVDSFFFMLIAHYYEIARIQLAMDTDLVISNSKKIIEALELLKRQKPIQYIIGETEFYGLEFKVNEHVLIPRPETEELVSWVVSEFNTKKKPLRILDIGTGSGCIAISLAKNLRNVKVYALDVSKEALKVAKGNAELNAVDIEFLELDVLETKRIRDLEFDIIVSNPPYVREKEKEKMRPNVLDNEPHLALFVKDENPLLFYNAIAQFANQNLANKGVLFFEINEFLGGNMINLLNKNHFKSIELKQDIFKKDRMIKGVKVL